MERTLSETAEEVTLYLCRCRVCPQLPQVIIILSVPMESLIRMSASYTRFWSSTHVLPWINLTHSICAITDGNNWISKFLFPHVSYWQDDLTLDIFITACALQIVSFLIHSAFYIICTHQFQTLLITHLHLHREAWKNVFRYQNSKSWLSTKRQTI